MLQLFCSFQPASAFLPSPPFQIDAAMRRGYPSFRFSLARPLYAYSGFVFPVTTSAWVGAMTRRLAAMVEAGLVQRAEAQFVPDRVARAVKGEARIRLTHNHT